MLAASREQFTDMGKSSVWLGVVMVVVVTGVAARAATIPGWRRSEAVNLNHRSVIPCIESDDPEPWCDPVLGCLYLTDDWFHSNRPFNVMPNSREHINTRFMLHTREKPAIHEDVFITANRSSVDNTTFDPNKPVKFIIHGFIDTGFLGWLREMAEALLAYGDYNVVRVDWGGGSLPMYCTATANTRVVGLEIAHLVNFLIDDYQLNPASVHLIGHSLGAHTSGYAGEKIQGLGRITGMDPAGPYFTGTPEFIRLDPSDAIFVDAIHTDSDPIYTLGYGTDQPMGNVDFYPNAGHDQPGCDPVSIGIDVIQDIGEGIRELAACSHGRSYKLFTDVLQQPCPYLAHECVDYESFEMGRCASCGEDNSKCAYMGMRAVEYSSPQRESVRLYLDTDAKSPYCYYHYQVIVDTSHPKEAEVFVQGHLDVTLYGDNGELLENLRLTKKHERFEHGQLKYFMFKSHIDLSRVIRLVAKWRYDDSLTNPGSYCWALLCNRSLYVRSIQVAPMDYYPEQNRLNHKHVLCQAGREYIKIKSGTSESLDYDESCVFSIQ